VFGWWQVMVNVIIGLYYAVVLGWAASYTYFSSDGEIIQSNMNKEIKQKAEKFHNGEEATSPSSSFIEILTLLW